MQEAAGIPKKRTMWTLGLVAALLLLAAGAWALRGRGPEAKMYMGCYAGAECVCHTQKAQVPCPSSPWEMREVECVLFKDETKETEAPCPEGEEGLCEEVAVTGPGGFSCEGLPPLPEKERT